MVTQITIGKKTYSISQNIQNICEEVMEEKGMDIFPARVMYILVSPEISPNILGRCIRANNMLKMLGECDYIIQMSAISWNEYGKIGKKRIAEHELKHIVIKVDNNTGEVKFALRKHDIEDFYEMITDYGIGWQATEEMYKDVLE